MTPTAQGTQQSNVLLLRRSTHRATGSRYVNSSAGQNGRSVPRAIAHYQRIRSEGSRSLLMQRTADARIEIECKFSRVLDDAADV